MADRVAQALMAPMDASREQLMRRAQSSQGDLWKELLGMGLMYGPMAMARPSPMPSMMPNTAGVQMPQGAAGLPPAWVGRGMGVEPYGTAYGRDARGWMAPQPATPTPANSNNPVARALLSVIQGGAPQK